MKLKGCPQISQGICGKPPTRPKSNNLGRDVETWKRRYGWSAHDIFRAKRKGPKPGGSEEYVATSAVLQKIYELKKN